MRCMATRNTTMFNLIRNGLSRLNRPDPQAPMRETTQACDYQDNSWHSSSFELARGLEVIECRGPYPAVFAGAGLAFQPARA